MTNMTFSRVDAVRTTRRRAHMQTPDLQLVTAHLIDVDSVVALFSALHGYNASLDPHFALADDWESLLRHEFQKTVCHPDHLWVLIKDGERAVGLLIAAVHMDSPMFRHRCWVEVEALYVDGSYRGKHVVQRLLDKAYSWAESKRIRRVQLYVTASNVRAQALYTKQGFTVTQAIMRKSL